VTGGQVRRRHEGRRRGDAETRGGAFPVRPSLSSPRTRGSRDRRWTMDPRVRGMTRRWGGSGTGAGRVSSRTFAIHPSSQRTLGSLAAPYDLAGSDPSFRWDDGIRWGNADDRKEDPLYRPPRHPREGGDPRFAV